jgi:hypothetical protein
MKKIFILLVFVIITFNLLLPFYSESTDLTEGLKRIDETGYKILDVIQSIAFWIITAKCCMDIISHVMQSQIKELGKVILGYVIAYSCLFFVPWVLKLVEGIF